MFKRSLLSASFPQPATIDWSWSNTIPLSGRQIGRTLNWYSAGVNSLSKATSNF